jgi:hypothetical protein
LIQTFGRNSNKSGFVATDTAVEAVSVAVAVGSGSSSSFSDWVMSV